MTPDHIRRWGITRPIYYFRGEILDGRKLAKAARLAGVKPPLEVELESLEEAQHYLAQAHPERAVKLWPSATVTEAAEKFGVPLSKIAKYFAPPPREKRRYPPRRRTGRKTRGGLGGPKMHIYISEELQRYVAECAAEIPTSKSEYIRGAIACSTPEGVKAKLIALSVAAENRRRNR